MSQLDLRGYCIIREAICEWASIIAKIPWVIKHTINYGPIHEWASEFAKILWVIKCIINHGPICEWVSASYNINTEQCWKLLWIFFMAIFLCRILRRTQMHTLHDCTQMAFTTQIYDCNCGQVVCAKSNTGHIVILLTCCKKSQNSAPNSTPVGPPPTITKCNNLLFSSSDSGVGAKWKVGGTGSVRY